MTEAIWTEATAFFMEQIEFVRVEINFIQIIYYSFYLELTHKTKNIKCYNIVNDIIIVI